MEEILFMNSIRIQKEFLPVYIISLGERPSFEISHQWIKDPIFFNYLWFSNFYDSETYLYLFLGKSNNSYIIRYDKTNGELRSYRSESLIKEISLPDPPNFIIRNRTNSFALIMTYLEGIHLKWSINQVTVNIGLM